MADQALAPPPDGVALPRTTPAAPRRGPRVRIAAKIFGTALTLVALLAVVAVFSTRNIGRVRTEMLAIAEVFTPLAYVASAIEIHQVEQELQLERALGAVGGASTAGPPKEGGGPVAALRAEGRGIDEQLAEATRLLDEGAVHAQRPEDHAELASLRERFRGIDREHHGFEERALAVLARLERGDRQAVAALLEPLPREEAEFVAELDRLRQDLERYSQASAQAAVTHQEQILRLNTIITIAAILAGILFAGVITSGLVRPIRRLVQGTADVEKGQLEVAVPVTSGDEIGTLTESFNSMVAQLRANERVKQTFGQYVDPRIVEQLLEQTGAAAAAGERRQVTVAFTDIRGFTGLAEILTPAALVLVINRYFTLMSDVVVQHGGIVDKFIGDAVMAFWSPPFVAPGEDATRACVAALRQAQQLQVLRAELPELLGFRKGAPDVGIRIGLASGEAIVGSIGSDRVKGFTVMGDTVNVASRLEGVGKVYGTQILIAEDTRRQAGGAIETREIDSIRVIGREDPLRVFELLGEAGTLDEETTQLRAAFERGLASYRGRDLAAARAHFTRCLEIRPGDGPAAVFLDRLARLQHAPPAAEWDGVWTLTSK